MNRPRRLRNWLLAGVLAASALRCGDNVAPPNAKAIQMTSGDGQSGPAQQPLPQPLVVLVTDDGGNPVAGVTVHWTPDEGTVSNSDVKTGSDGHASVQRVLGPTAGQQTTTASVSGLDGSPVTFTATALPAGSPGIALVTPPPSSALDAEVFDPANQPVIALSDDQGNPRAGVQVTARIASGGGTLEGTTTATTDANGRAAFGDLGIRGPGSNTIQFAAGAATVTSSAITISPLPVEASTGAWGPVVQWDIVPLQMTLFPNGKIFAWGKRDPADSIGKPHLWDPAAGPPTTAIEVGGVSDMLFCAGHTLLPDGRLITAGGHFMDDAGIKATYFFTQDGSAQKGPDMAFGRWYPTLTVLGDGRVLTMAGRNEQSTTITIPEIWEGNQWVQLPGGSDVALPYYPRNFVDPNPSRHGQVFMSGERIVSRWFDVDGVGANGGRGKWTTGPAHKYNFNRDYGTAVMYETGKILYAGGGGYPRWSSPPADKSDLTPTATAETIDLTSGSPSWQFTAPMQFARRHLNSTVLPDGQVLVTGGVGGGTSGTGTSAIYNFNAVRTQAHREAEIWNPKTGQWTTLAAAARPRGYHSVSILLPDGTVLHGSSGDAQEPPQNPNAGQLYPDEKNHEIFSPPYLFKGARPKITSAPPTVGYGAVFSVATPNAAQVTEVRWIRVGSVTHAFDMSARANTLPFTRTATGVDVSTASLTPAAAPPGYYLLFILNRNGVPSEGQFIKIG